MLQNDFDSDLIDGGVGDTVVWPFPFGEGYFVGAAILEEKANFAKQPDASFFLEDCYIGFSPLVRIPTFRRCFDGRARCKLLSRWLIGGYGSCHTPILPHPRKGWDVDYAGGE